MSAVIKKYRWIIILALAIVALAIIGYLLVGGKSNLFKIPFPLTYSVADSTSFACEALISAYIIGSEVEYLTNGIEGMVEKGTDTVAMKVKDAQTLEFLTRASLEIGVTEGSQFSILQNNLEKLIAVYVDDKGVDTVVLNKKNGLAVWTKADSDFLGSLYGAPRGQVIYFACR